ncbi:hypothetical protein LXL04_036886 [Taraxacum kok-saghyz]
MTSPLTNDDVVERRVDAADHRVSVLEEKWAVCHGLTLQLATTSCATKLLSNLVCSTSSKEPSRFTWLPSSMDLEDSRLSWPPLEWYNAFGRALEGSGIAECDTLPHSSP